MTRRMMAIAIGAGLLVLVLWYFMLWKPQQNSISDAKDRRQTAEDQAAQLRVTLSRLEELRRGAALTQSRIEQLRVAVPEQPNLAQLILDVNDAANRAGIEFMSITPSPPTAAAAGGASAINLSLSLTGGYFQVIDFVNRLTALPRVIVIDTISLGGSQPSGGLSVSITGRAFTTATATSPGLAPTTTVPTAAPTATTTTAPPGATTTTGAP